MSKQSLRERLEQARTKTAKISAKVDGDRKERARVEEEARDLLERVRPSDDAPPISWRSEGDPEGRLLATRFDPASNSGVRVFHSPRRRQLTAMSRAELREMFNGSIFDRPQPGTELSQILKQLGFAA